jgi:hypothetical protein
VTFACAGAGLDAGAALACAGAGGSAGFGFACLGTLAGPGFAFAVALGFFADFSFSGVPVGAGVAVAPCVAQDCHGQHIALAGSVRSINADTAKGTVNFAFTETLPFTVVSQARANGRFLVLQAALITTTQIPQCGNIERPNLLHRLRPAVRGLGSLRKFDSHPFHHVGINVGGSCFKAAMRASLAPFFRASAMASLNP